MRLLLILFLVAGAARGQDRCSQQFRWLEKVLSWTKNQIIPDGTLSLSQTKFDRALADYTQYIGDAAWFKANPPKSPEEKLAYAEAMIQRAGKGHFVARSLSEIRPVARAKLARALRKADFEQGVSRAQFENAYRSAWDILNPRAPVEGSGGWITRYRLRHQAWDARQRDKAAKVLSLDEALKEQGFDQIPGFGEAIAAFKRRHPRISSMGSFAVWSAVIFAADYLLNPKDEAQQASKMIEAIEENSQNFNSDVFINDLFEGMDPSDPLVQRLKEADRKFMESQKLER